MHLIHKLSVKSISHVRVERGTNAGLIVTLYKHFHMLAYIYIYASSRRFYPKRLTVHSGNTCFITMCVPWESNPQPFALLTQCSTTEPQECYAFNNRIYKISYYFHAISYYFLAISSLGYIEKKCAKVKKSFEDIAEHLFNHCKSKFLAEVNLSSRFLVFI